MAKTPSRATPNNPAPSNRQPSRPRDTPRPFKPPPTPSKG